MLAVARQSFVNGVIYDFIDKVVQTGSGGGADIHTGTLAHGLQPFQNLNLIGVIFLFDPLI